MASVQDQIKMSDEEENFLRAIQMPSGIACALVWRAAVELDLFKLMAKAGPGAQLSSSDIASYLPTKNAEAPFMLDRILRFLASQSILNCTLITDEDGHAKRLYSLTPMCKSFIRNQDGDSIAPLLLFHTDKVPVEPWYHIKEAILEGGIPFSRAYGMSAYEYPGKDSRFNEVFNKAMYSHTTVVMKKIVELYNGFDGVKEIIDVGGGLGASLASILSKYPNIKGINFDLPHVIKDAPIFPGMVHVEGDMFESVPKGEVILLKWILHDWSDEHCLKLLKNCWRALPESGKVIVVETLLSEHPKTDVLSSVGFYQDVCMMIINHGGKERTLKEFEALAKEAGFATLKIVCHAYHDWVMELYKN